MQYREYVCAYTVNTGRLVIAPVQIHIDTVCSNTMVNPVFIHFTPLGSNFHAGSGESTLFMQFYSGTSLFFASVPF